MSEPDPSSSRSFLIQSIDMDELESRLATLLTNYRDALVIVARLPRMGRWPTRTSQKSSEQQPNPSGKQRHRFVIRAFVRLFVELHIRRKLSTIARVLSIEAVALPDSHEHGEKLKAYTKRLEDFRSLLMGWGRLSGFLTKAPLLSALLPLVTAVILKLSGVDFSDASALGASVVERSQSGGWTFLLRFLTFIGIAVLYAYLFLAPFVVGFGFRCKRAIFSGGKTVKDIFEWSPIGPEEEIWQRLPTTNIYQTENMLFKTLRVSKPGEFPLDLFATITPYFSLVAAILISVHSLTLLKYGIAPPKLEIVLAGVIWLGVAFLFFSGVKNYRARVRTNNL